MATTFKDTANREWSLSIDVFLLEQVENRTGVKIGQLLNNNAAALIDLLNEPVKFVRVLWVLVEEQAEKAGVKPEQFGRALAGEALGEAANAFMEALAFFSPRRQQREMIQALTAKGNELAEAVASRVMEEIRTIDVKSFASVTKSPGLPELIPAGAG